EEVAPARVIEDGRRFQSMFFEGEIGELGSLAGAIDREAFRPGSNLGLQREMQVTPRLLVQPERVLHELVGQARLFADALRGDQVQQAVRLNVDTLDESLADQP